ncbi:sigma-70 family RNA polymerase sigma factor [Paenibacillus sp. FSL R7-0331]|uniref:sigma-70 family RNA polymerase sigma factor n=1 Tax=Paenibacillus sp. FSL R7-0331 TaxID=1536773 RepID=UPI0004F6796A|nr:sigma-70 family RNA polymerase sigma factor [Paenibacillus sp. FSL R7-0331]AIQ54536.1 hypothetical protein R70331_25470 [Paenibacillus sp. FSL R7-0331]
MPVTADLQQAGPRYYNPHLGDVDEFILRYKALVFSVAYKCQRRTRLKVDVEDLAQEGFVSLLRAYSDFDPARGEFTTFAVPRMRGRIMNYIRDKVPIVRAPRNIYYLAGSILLHKKADMSPDELAKEFRCPVDHVNKALEQIETAIHLSLFQGSDSKSELIDSFVTEADYTRIFVHDFKQNILTEREKFVLELSLSGISQQVIAEHLNCSQMTVSRAYQRVQKRAAKYFGIEVT